MLVFICKFMNIGIYINVSQCICILECLSIQILFLLRYEKNKILNFKLLCSILNIDFSLKNQFFEYLFLSRLSSGKKVCECCCSVPQSCPTLCNPIDCSMSGLPVPHHLLKFAQVHGHCINNAIQPSHPLTSSSPSALNPSQHQGLFQ